MTLLKADRLSRKTFAVIISTLFLALFMQGCSDVNTLVWNKADAFIDGHHVVIRPCRESYTKTLADSPNNRHQIFGCDNSTTVEIKNEELTVDKKSYGMLERGAEVVVKDSKVYINKKEAAEIAKN